VTSGLCTGIVTQVDLTHALNVTFVTSTAGRCALSWRQPRRMECGHARVPAHRPRAPRLGRPLAWWASRLPRPSGGRGGHPPGDVVEIEAPFHSAAPLWCASASPRRPRPRIAAAISSTRGSRMSGCHLPPTRRQLGRSRADPGRRRSGAERQIAGGVVAPATPAGFPSSLGGPSQRRQVHLPRPRQRALRGDLQRAGRPSPAKLARSGRGSAGRSWSTCRAPARWPIVRSSAPLSGTRSWPRLPTRSS